MQKLSIITFFISILLVQGHKSLWAQQRHSAKHANLFSVYTSQTNENRDLTNRDMRLMKMRRMEEQYSLPKYKSLQQWKKHRQYLREHILVSAGLWPQPAQKPLNARVFDKVIHEKYTVEKVYIEPYPNFYLAGNLYKPRGLKGPFPAVLAPHGHWVRGRLINGARDSVDFHYGTPQDPWLNENGDRALGTGHASVPGRAIHFAKAGYVTFTYDMVGYGDTKQIGHDFAAGDSLAQLWGINLMGLQLWDSMQAFRFLRNLPEVDPTKIGVTGASGGGTQTFMLDAVTDSSKIQVTAPVNMISSVYQGGGLCENAPGLRLNTFNVEVAGMFAPRPQYMISNTHDWSRNTPWAEYPMMKSIYKLYNAEDHVDYSYFDYPHNYNKPAREAVYEWFQQWMPGKRPNYPTEEQPFTVEPDSNLLVFLKKPVLDRDSTFNQMDPSQYHNLPDGALKLDEEVLKRNLKEYAEEQLTKYWPTSKSKWSRFDSLYSTAYHHALADSVPANVNVKVLKEGSKNEFNYKKLVIERGEKHDWIPGILFEPKNQPNSKGVTLIISPKGKSGIANDNKTGPNKLVQELLDQGQRVMAIDVFKTGEHKLLELVPTERNENQAHFTTYNKTDTQEQIQDILTTSSYLKNAYEGEKINLIGLDKAGVWTLLAAPLTDHFDRIIADQNKLSSDQPEQFLSFFVPNLLKLGGLQTALALNGKHNTKLTVYNVNPAMDKEKVEEVYKMLNRPDNITFVKGNLNEQDIIKGLGI